MCSRTESDTAAFYVTLCPLWIETTRFTGSDSESGREHLVQAISEQFWRGLERLPCSCVPNRTKGENTRFRIKRSDRARCERALKHPSSPPRWGTQVWRWRRLRQDWGLQGQRTRGFWPGWLWPRRLRQRWPRRPTLRYGVSVPSPEGITALGWKTCY